MSTRIIIPGVVLSKLKALVFIIFLEETKGNANLSICFIGREGRLSHF
jgi:hypothetical protein